MHPSTYEYLKPTDEQLAQMDRIRAASKVYLEVLEAELPDGPNKTSVIRNLLSSTKRGINAMWANAAITRQPDGTPRS